MEGSFTFTGLFSAEQERRVTDKGRDGWWGERCATVRTTCRGNPEQRPTASSRDRAGAGSQGRGLRAKALHVEGSLSGAPAPCVQAAALSELAALGSPSLRFVMKGSIVTAWLSSCQKSCRRLECLCCEENHC